MSNYLETNSHYWNDIIPEYSAPNVESFIFRFYGRILKFDYGIDGTAGENVLDFGCGQGGALSFFNKLGFNCFGVDIAKNDVAYAKNIMPGVADQLMVIDPKPVPGECYFDEKMDIVISIQTLDFLTNSDFQTVIKNLYDNMKPGAKIFASMNGWDMYYRNHAQYVEDGLWHVEFDNGRVSYDIYLNFIKDKAEMVEKFNLFKPVYVDYYDSSFREEGSEFRYTFFGVKE